MDTVQGKQASLGYLKREKKGKEDWTGYELAADCK
jgi:hypothetical protein